MKYWLLKSEESCYSIDNLKADKTTSWTGVRNYQARNYMKDMRVGDLCLFYHSNSSPTGVVGVCQVSKAAHPDTTALDPKDDHYDPKASSEKPIWECVDVKFVSKGKRCLTLSEIKMDSELSKMVVAQRGSRLSITPVSQKHFELIAEIIR